MNYKETLFFIGKCLIINHEEHNKILVEEQLKLNTVDWDNIVRVSTAHFVFPALYCNLKRADFLHYLPNDLVEYMQHITNLNRERNEQIIEQAKEINELLLANNITPIFLKGTAYLLQNLYEDIGERMVGDIDFLVEREDARKVNSLLLKNEYKPLEKGLHEDHRHLTRLVRKDRIGALEIHKEMLAQKACEQFNLKTVESGIWTKNNISFLSIQDQIQLSSLAFQVNDEGYFLNKIALKTSYDIFLFFLKLDNKINANSDLKEYINSYLGVTSKVLNSKKIYFPKSKDTKRYVNKTIALLQANKTKKFFYTIKEKTSQNLTRLKILIKSLYNKNYRKFVMERITDKQWLQEKYNQFFSK